MRHQDWPARLAKLVAAARSRPFEWSTHDCATFARDWIETATGVRVFEVPYTDALSAARFIEAQGGMLAASTAVLGEPMPNPMAASRGDVALVQIEERECLTIVLGEFAAGPGKAGLVMVPRDQMTAAWSI